MLTRLFQGPILGQGGDGGRGLAHAEALLQDDAPLVVLLHQRGGQGGSAAHHQAHLVKGGGVELRGLHQEQEDGRHPEEQGDVLLAQQLQGLGRVKGALDHHRGPHVEHGQGEQADAPDVEHGQHQQIAVLAGELHVHVQVQGVPQAVGLGEHRALGLARGAGGVHDYVRRVGGDGLGRLRLLSDLGGQELLVGQGPVLFLRAQHHPQVHGRGLVEALGQLAQLGVVDKGPGLAVACLEAQLGRGEPPVQGHQHQPQLGGGHDDLHVLQAVHGEHGHPVALGQALGLQGPGQAVHPLVELGVAQTPPAVHHRLALRADPGPQGEPVTDAAHGAVQGCGLRHRAFPSPGPGWPRSWPRAACPPGPGPRRGPRWCRPCPRSSRWSRARLCR